jgi:hypothetical protein
VIIGAQRAGTTSLYRYVTGHPRVRPAVTKELRFFDVRFERGSTWYRSNFPLAIGRVVDRRRGRQPFVTGESSPDYLFHPEAPKRMAGLIPHAKLIVLLRNPVDRAWSHYWHQVRLGHEHLTFEEAIAAEDDRLDGEDEPAGREVLAMGYERHHHSYVARGRYADQLGRWMEFFPKDQFLVERSEDLFSDPAGTIGRLFDFLALAPWTPPRFEVFNAFSDGIMPDGVRSDLIERFRPDNAALEGMLGRRLDWDR